MAIIYPKVTTLGTKNCLILGPRETLSYPFDIGDWETARFAFYVSCTTADNDNHNYIYYEENFPVDSVLDKVFIGIRPLSDKFPSQSNNYFLGFSNSSDRSRFNFSQPPYGDTAYGARICDCLLQLIYPNNSRADSGLAPYATFHMGEMSQLAESFCTLYIFEMKILNKGQPNQQVQLRFQMDDGETDTSTENLRMKMLSVGFDDRNPILNFNNSGSPYTLPNSFFFYTPFANLRLRFHNIAAMKIN